MSEDNMSIITTPTRWGTWIARTSDTATIHVGVIAPNQYEARQRLSEALARWEALRLIVEREDARE